MSAVSNKHARQLMREQAQAIREGAVPRSGRPPTYTSPVDYAIKVDDVPLRMTLRYLIDGDAKWHREHPHPHKLLVQDTQGNWWHVSGVEGSSGLTCRNLDEDALSGLVRRVDPKELRGDYSAMPDHYREFVDSSRR